ncbi:MAG: hypothetical protein JNJ61_30585 [Anaerolineae bacterium]|nr:hypothetical protein [Anaerolineae bacterium]
MDPFPLDTTSFVVKVWLEQPAEAGSAAVWRGHITHVPSGTRRYVKNLSEVTDFIVPYLKEMGVDFRLIPQIRRYLTGI